MLGKKMVCVSILLLLGFVTQDANALSEEDLLGRWEVVIDDTGDTFGASWLEVIRENGKLDGSLLWRWGSVEPIEWIRIEGDEVLINRPEHHNKKRVDVIYRARLHYDRLVGMVERPGGGIQHFHGRPAIAPQVDVSGTWDVIIHMGEKRRIRHTLRLLQEKEKIVGLLGAHGQVAEVKEAKLDGRQLTLRFSPVSVQAHETEMSLAVEVRGDRIVGKGKMGSDREFDVTGQRHRMWGEPVDLFNGKNLENWLTRDRQDEMKWYVEDGIMVCTGEGGDIYTEQVFDDFQLHVEFKLSEGANSGVYLRGRYENQLLDDYGKGVESHGMGSVYSRIAPTKNATKPAGEWQSYDITLIGRWLTVRLNGVTVVDNQYLEGITGGALDPHENKPGPIMLQDHGDKVWFRKVTLTPMVR